MGIALVGGAVIVWVWIALLVSARAVELATADPIGGISRRRLAVLGFLWWPVVFVSVTFLLFRLFSLTTLCDGPHLSWADGINCYFEWAAMILLAALVAATIAAVLIVKWVRSRQSAARDSQETDSGSVQ